MSVLGVTERQLEETNHLLEQMRRAALTPAQRAKEDIERTAALARTSKFETKVSDIVLAALLFFAGKRGQTKNQTKS